MLRLPPGAGCKAPVSRAFQLRFACLKPTRKPEFCLMLRLPPQSALLSGGSTALTLVCRLPASSPARTFKRCRRRISETYRTYGTYRTKADRMANFFSADLLWCGSRPPIHQMKKSSDYTSSVLPVAKPAED